MASWLPGDAVLTSFGVGVIITCPADDDTIKQYAVRLWRDPGTSIGSTATAYLQPEAVSYLDPSLLLFLTEYCI